MNRNYLKKICKFADDRDYLASLLNRLRRGENYTSDEQKCVEKIADKWSGEPILHRSIENTLATLNKFTLVKTSNIIEFPGSNSQDRVIQSNVEVSLEETVLHNGQSDTNKFLPSSQGIHDFFQNQGIIGEDKNAELLIYGIIAKSNIGIESLAGSGKSALLYSLLSAVPDEKYLVIHQATSKSLFNDPRANKVDYWIIPELQKVFNRDIEEIIKNLAEGVSATYSRTSANRKNVDLIKINKKSILYSFAVSNKYMHNRDDEFYRRFIILNTNVSKQNNRIVTQSIAERDLIGVRESQDTQGFKQHITYCLNNEKKIVNPFLPYVVENLPDIIRDAMRFRTSINFLKSLVAGRCNFMKNGSYATVQDNFKVLSLYKNILIDNTLGLGIEARAVLNTMQEIGLPELQYDLLCETYQAQYNLPIDKGLSDLVNNNLVIKDNALLSLGKKHVLDIDEEYAFTHADDIMKEQFPKQRDEWYSKCLLEFSNNEI
tara:strand:+ start:18316 stop:19782 length:1467 start_codon:yes stop_codon:yes gene_type:complete